ncbi:secreted RxLR effector protein 161-like [Lathyrus oleraceus]|uniref:secreted RxLR effector protein 161-like n=1 Tax=Pisum sativum TaxID=3888 RepID=UPI0021D02399|nr:secreted RxLR effector protein 161-like [Pisum sativum]
MEDCNAISTLVEPELHLSNNSNEDDVDPTQYKRLIGSLRYLCCLRPDLEYNVYMVSRFMQKPKVSHIAVTKRILRYLKGTLDYDIMFPASDVGKKCKLMGYIGSSWYNDTEDRKSITGYLFMLGGALVAWSSRKEPVVAWSSCEAKYINASLCACQATWMVNLVK